MPSLPHAQRWIYSLHVSIVFTHVHVHHRTEFRVYLCRPDTKQEFVTQWQCSYNDLPLHLRREVVMKAELHKRVDVSIILSAITD